MKKTKKNEEITKKSHAHTRKKTKLIKIKAKASKIAKIR